MRTAGLHPILMVSLLLAGCMAQQKEPTLNYLAESQIQAPPQTVSFDIKTFCSPGHSPNQYVDFFFSNRSAQVHQGLLVPDSDADGLVDQVERQNGSRLGIRPNLSQSVAAYFSDLLVYAAGILPKDQNRLRCSGNSDRTDNDRDGLLLCEERILQTNPDLFDTDGDGIPDSIELRCGLNPRDPADAALDSDSDGVTNIQECKLNTPIDYDNRTPSVAQVAYKYRTEKILTPSPCMRFLVENVPVLQEAGINQISAVFIQKNAVTGIREMLSFETQISAELGGNPGDTITCTAVPGPAGTLQGSCEHR